jgi:hypothetical protein
MNNRLEQYVDEVAHNLRSLPEEQRQEEIAEIRSHLDARVAAEMELGKTQEEAVAEALRQFGSARKVGSSLRRVWRRRTGAIRLRSAFLGAVVSTAILCVLNVELNLWWVSNVNQIVAGVDVAMATCWCLFGLIGLIIGGATRSSRGVLIGAVAFLVAVSATNLYMGHVYGPIETRLIADLILLMAASGWAGERLGRLVLGAARRAPVPQLVFTGNVSPFSGRFEDEAGVDTIETDRVREGRAGREGAQAVGNVIEITFRIRIR